LTQDHPLSLSDIDPDDIVERKVVDHPKVTNQWSIVRHIALQVLYEVDSADHPVGDVLNKHLAGHQLPPKTADYLRQLVLTILENHRRIDAVIQNAAPEWPLQQLALVDRNVLRIAICEFAILTRTPLKVAIDEAVRMAKIFGAEGSSRFINGVLGTLANDAEGLRESLTARGDDVDNPTDE
jgi:N utilization substance protein B